MAAALINALGKKEGDTETDTKKATEEAVAKAQAEAEEAVKAEIDEAVTKGETEGKGQCPARLPRELRCRAKKNAGLPQVTMDSESRLPTRKFPIGPREARGRGRAHGCTYPRMHGPSHPSKTDFRNKRTRPHAAQVQAQRHSKLPATKLIVSCGLICLSSLTQLAMRKTLQSTRGRRLRWATAGGWTCMGTPCAKQGCPSLGSQAGLLLCSS